MGRFTFNLPDVGEGIAEVEIEEWQVAPGDTVSEDDILCSVLTDKAAVEIPSPVDGVVLYIGPEAGSTMAVGSLLITLEVAGEGEAVQGEAEDSPSIETRSTQQENTQESVPAPTLQPSSVSVQTVESQDQPVALNAKGKALAAPSVRARARELNLNLQSIRGTGPAGRITHADLDAYLRGGSTKAFAQSMEPDNSVRQIKVTGIRKKIGQIMQDTMQRIPHYSYVEEVDVTELEALRQKLNSERSQEQPKLTVLPFIMRAITLALKRFPEMASRYDDEAQVLEQHAGVHIGIATQTDAGLLVPVVRHAEMLDVWETADRLTELAEKSRSGKATREELSGSTITLTSLGPLGGIVTTPVINSPEVAIVGVNKIATRPVWQHGAFVPREIMNLSSSFDHRIIDGWEATQFIQVVKSHLECPALLFIKPYVQGAAHETSAV